MNDGIENVIFVYLHVCACVCAHTHTQSIQPYKEGNPAICNNLKEPGEIYAK